MRIAYVLLVLSVFPACGDDDADPDARVGSYFDAHSGDASADAGSGPDAAPGNFSLPPLNGRFDYQLGGAYDPPDGVTIVSRDRTADIAPGLYNICYVNGFQIQPDEEDFWLTEHPDLVLRDDGGNPVVDEEWDEMLIDVGTVDKRLRVAEIVNGWIAGCAEAGFDALEIDNLDSFTRSGDRLDENDAVAAMRLFADAAHARGLAAAQKNSAEMVERKAELGTDFVVAEECNAFAECEVYSAAYGSQVIVIEYEEAAFEQGCADFPHLPIVLRDVELRTPGQTGYVFDDC